VSILGLRVLQLARSIVAYARIGGSVAHADPSADLPMTSPAAPWRARPAYANAADASWAQARWSRDFM